MHRTKRLVGATGSDRAPGMVNIFITTIVLLVAVGVDAIVSVRYTQTSTNPTSEAN
jgi:hypothetical protein